MTLIHLFLADISSHCTDRAKQLFTQFDRIEMNVIQIY